MVFNLSITSIAVLLAIILEAALTARIPHTYNQYAITTGHKTVGIRTSIGFRSGQCQNLRDVDNPTKISLRRARGRWQLETSTQLCNDPEWRPQRVFNISRSTPRVLNRRRPIRSFRLNDPVSRKNPLEVTFLWNKPCRGFTKVNVSDTRCISNFGLGPSWYPYSHTVHLTRGGRTSAASLSVFSDNNCQSEIHSDVGDAADLVAMTRKHPHNIVRSIRFKRVKLAKL